MTYICTWAIAFLLAMTGLDVEDGPETAIIEVVGLQFSFEGSWWLTDPVELQNGRTRVDLRYGLPEGEHTSTFIRFEAMQLEEGHAKIIQDNLDAIERQTLDGFEDQIEGYEFIGNHRVEMLDAEAFVIDCRVTNSSGRLARLRFFFFVLDQPDRLVTIYLRSDVQAWEEHHHSMEQFLATLEPVPQPNQPAED